MSSNHGDLIVKHDFDVIVVGAGPAGSTAARILADNGHHVLLLDRRKKVGIPVQCGGLLPSPAELQDMFPRSPRMWRMARVPKDVILNQTSHINLRSPRNRVHAFSFKMNILDREKYDKHLVNLAEWAGTELRLNSWVRSRRSDNQLSVSTPDGHLTLSAKAVIGADGPASVISRSLGNNYESLDRNLSLSLQHQLTEVSVDTSCVEMLFGGNVAPGGYGWLIPMGGSEVRVGLGLRRFLAPKGASLKRYLHNILSGYPSLAQGLASSKIVSQVGALIPMGGPVKKAASKNCILVGDAAGLVMATNGGGIPTALASGEIAGRIVDSHFRNGTPLTDYERHWRYEMGTELETAKVSLRIADQFMRSDSLTELGMRILGSRFLESVIRCRMPLPSIVSRMIVAGLKDFV